MNPENQFGIDFKINKHQIDQIFLFIFSDLWRTYSKDVNQYFWVKMEIFMQGYILFLLIFSQQNENCIDINCSDDVKI